MKSLLTEDEMAIQLVPVHHYRSRSSSGRLPISTVNLSYSHGSLMRTEMYDDECWDLLTNVGEL